MESEPVHAVTLPHHEQQPLCTTRLPYRQGRKLTAVKVYTINNESNHLLVFGVPSLNLRQEAKALFSKFGKLIQFSVSMEHPAEAFTETYHAAFERIQSARIAKRMLDTKTFYGGSLHICYAPEFETLIETRSKLIQRQKDVLSRLKNLDNEPKVTDKCTEVPVAIATDTEKKKLNMGELNTIDKSYNQVSCSKRSKSSDNVVVQKKFKPCFISDEIGPNNISNHSSPKVCDGIDKRNIKNKSDITESDSHIEIIDFTSAEKDTLTNINESLNYNKFGNEIVRKVPVKAVNRIQFNVSNKR